MVSTLDTAAAAERLVQAGADPALARAMVTGVARTDEGIVTKAGPSALRSELEAAMLRLERRLIPAGLAGLGLLFAALRLTG